MHILIADDDQEDLELIGEALLNAEPGAKLHTVMDGKAAIDYLDGLQDKELPCLIVLDYNMPQMNGAQALLAMSKVDRLKDIPRVILSTSNVALYMHESKSNGATDYFVKPSTKTELDELAKTMLAFCA